MTAQDSTLYQCPIATETCHCPHDKPHLKERLCEWACNSTLGEQACEPVVSPTPSKPVSESVKPDGIRFELPNNFPCLGVTTPECQAKDICDECYRNWYEAEAAITADLRQEIERLNGIIRDAYELLDEEMGEWGSVDKSQCPESIYNLKQISEVLAQSLEGSK